MMVMGINHSCYAEFDALENLMALKTTLLPDVERSSYGYERCICKIGNQTLGTTKQTKTYPVSFSGEEKQAPSVLAKINVEKYKVPGMVKNNYCMPRVTKLVDSTGDITGEFVETVIWHQSNWTNHIYPIWAETHTNFKGETSASIEKMDARLELYLNDNPNSVNMFAPATCKRSPCR